MENYNVLVLMEKDPETGFLTNTIESYTIDTHIELIEGLNFASEEATDFIYLTLTTQDVEEWQYNGIYDLYEEDLLQPFALELLDGSGEYNPRWILKMPFTQERSAMESIFNQILEVHYQELQRVFSLIAGNKEKYSQIEE